MLEQLEKDPIKIFSPSLNEMMSVQAWETLEIDTTREFKFEDEVTENDLAAVEDNSEVVDATTVQSNNDQSNSTSIPRHHVSCSNLTNDPDIKRDSKFLDKMQQIMTNGNTSKLLIPYLFQFRATYQKARRSVKKRIESKVPEESTQEIDSYNIVEIST